MKDDRLYAKFTLDFPDHPKILCLSPEAKWALVEMILSSHKSRSGGFIQPDRWDSPVLSELTHAGLLDNSWHLVDFADFPLGSQSRPAIPVEVRRAVMERDGHACVFCGATDQLSLDHIVRYRDGGPDTVENLRVLCMPCNLERG